MSSEVKTHLVKWKIVEVLPSKYTYGIHVSTKTSNHGSIVFDEIEIEAFEIFGTFQLNFAHQHAPKAFQNSHTE